MGEANERVRGLHLTVVLEEAGRGDPDQELRRLELLASFPILDTTVEVEDLAATYLEKLSLPDRAFRDAAHLAFACWFELDYLVTWNCAHLANAEVRRRLKHMNSVTGLQTPTICTPEELMGYN